MDRSIVSEVIWISLILLLLVLWGGIQIAGMETAARKQQECRVLDVRFRESEEAAGQKAPQYDLVVRLNQPTAYELADGKAGEPFRLSFSDSCVSDRLQPAGLRNDLIERVWLDRSPEGGVVIAFLPESDAVSIEDRSTSNPTESVVVRVTRREAPRTASGMLTHRIHGEQMSGVSSGGMDPGSI